MSSIQRVAAMHIALAKGWMGVKRFFPHVRSPVFHATQGTRVMRIVTEGLKPAESATGLRPAQVGISLTRDLTFALKGQFGRFVIVMDLNELKRLFHITPSQYQGMRGGWEDEFEERAWADRIPVSMIHGIVTTFIPGRAYLKDWRENIPVPVVYPQDGKWETTG